jgi:hypothetical protein
MDILMKRNAFVLSIFLGLAFTTSYSFSQVMEKSHVIAEPLQYSKNGNFTGCGINFRFLEDAKTASLNYATFSINFYLDNLNGALLKTSYSKVVIGNGPPQTQKKKIESSWIRLNSKDPLTVIKTMKGEDDAILSISDSSKSLSFLYEILMSEPNIQLGLKEPGKSFETIMYGNSVMKDEDKLQVANCLKELTDKSK